MKKSFLIILLGLIGIFAAIYAYTYPYAFYLKALNEGVVDDKLSLGSMDAKFFDGKVYPNRRFKDDYKGNPELWKNYHFSDFILPLPVNQPTFNFVPIIERVGKSEDKIGFIIADGNYKPLVEIQVLKKEKLNLESDQWLFNLPYFKNYILKKSQSEVWEDLFKRKIDRPLPEGFFGLKSLWELKKVGMRPLVYNLFLLNLRKNVFPKNVKNFGFVSEKKSGVVELTQKKMYIERIMVLNEGIVNSIQIKTKPHLDEPDFIRELFFKNLEFKESDSDESISIYAEHQTLPFQDRFDQRGMMVLFSALSHNLENKKMIKEIIRYLERGRADEQKIKPFYDYAYINYGTNFSEMDFYRKEDTTQYLRRKSVEEQEVEKKKEIVEQKDEFESEQDKVKSFLNRAKSKKNKDKNENKMLGL